MKIKIKSLIQQNQVYNGTNKQGKPYSIYSAKAHIFVDGQLLEATIKSMSKQIWDTLAIDKDYEADRQDYQGNVSYMIKTQNNFIANKWQKQEKISWKRYTGFVKECWKLSNELSKEKAEIIFDKILGCGSILIDFKQQPKNKEEQKQNPAEKFLKEKKDDNLIEDGKEPEFDGYDEEDLKDIPF